MMILVTGAAGLVGFHVCRRLLLVGHEVHGLDKVDDSSDFSLKEASVRLLRGQPGAVGRWRFVDWYGDDYRV